MPLSKLINVPNLANETIRRHKNGPNIKKLYFRQFYYKAFFPLRILSLLLAVHNIRRYKFSDLDDIINFVYTFKLFGISIRPMQVREEIKELLTILRSMKPKVILEIGTAKGGTLFLFCSVASDDAIIISIDLPGGPFGGGYPIWRIPLYRAFARKNQRLYLLRADSHDQKTLEVVKRILGSRKLDFLFIDGDHSYEGVKKDFEMYGPLVRKGGIIAFHDIAQGPIENVGGVPKFWDEIKHNYKHREIIKDVTQGGYGIGIIYVT